MDNRLREKLEERNKKIIDAVIEKAKRVCPDSIALIGIAGSFCSGDIYEKSDLDLLIVINDEKGWNIGSCFILEDVAHDIYCTPWEQLEEMAQYNNPYITKLIDLKIVYCADDRYLKKYNELSEKAKNVLEKPFNIEDLNKLKKHYDNALKAYGNMMLKEDYSECKYASSEVIIYIEYIIYMINKEYIKKGIKRIPEEISKMSKLPEYFNEQYFQAIKADTVKAIKENITFLLKSVKKYLDEIENKLIEKRKIDINNLRGSYEEIYSNWRNKMYHAAESNNIYLSFMTAVSCQQFYDEMYEEFDIKRINLMKNFDVDNLYKSAKAFDSAMEEYKKLYAMNGLNVLHYDNINQFLTDYLKK